MFLHLFFGILVFHSSRSSVLYSSCLFSVNIKSYHHSYTFEYNFYDMVNVTEFFLHYEFLFRLFCVDLEYTTLDVL